jgi:hypothetical protein
LWQARRHLFDMQFIAEDLLILNLDVTPSHPPANREAERSLLAGEVAAESLRASGRLRLRVRGESMLPALWPGDEVEIAKCSIDTLRPGDIALAVRDGRFFLHRFMTRSAGDSFLLRGDSMPNLDPEFSNEMLLGRVTGSHRPIRLWSSLGSRIVGRLLCNCGPVRRLALKLHAAGCASPNCSAANPRSPLGYIRSSHAGDWPITQ